MGRGISGDREETTEREIRGAEGRGGRRGIGWERARERKTSVIVYTEWSSC